MDLGDRESDSLLPAKTELSICGAIPPLPETSFVSLCLIKRTDELYFNFKLMWRLKQSLL
jgi:hypothetical protein